MNAERRDRLKFLEPLPLGSLAPALVSGVSLADAATGRLVWTGRARGSGAANEAAQVGELT